MLVKNVYSILKVIILILMFSYEEKDLFFDWFIWEIVF